MILIDGLALLAAMLAGGAGGWLAAATDHRRVAERERSYEQELADYREIYAAWGMLRRTRCADPAKNDQSEQ
jgi:hypothetical protein